ncbi:MAG: hypothetical protein AB1576_10390 [Bacillota bacterium]
MGEPGYAEWIPAGPDGWKAHLAAAETAGEGGLRLEECFRGDALPGSGPGKEVSLAALWALIARSPAGDDSSGVLDEFWGLSW